MLDTVLPGQAVPRAFLRVGGASLARHQLGVARRLGCQQLVCMARGVSPELIDLQQHAEAAGMKFHILGEARGLAGLVSAHDELLVLSEGLLVDPDMLASQLEGRQRVLVQPADGAMEAGFERIDADFASAGAMLVSGRLVEALHELPADCDVASALTRIALQQGVRRKEVPAALRIGAQWRMIANEADAEVIEPDWFSQALGETPERSPGFVLARHAALRFGPVLLEAGKPALVLPALAIFLLAIAVGLAWTFSAIAGIALCALAWLLARLHELLGRVRRRIDARPLSSLPTVGVIGWLCDVGIVLCLAAAIPAASVSSPLEALFAPVMLILLLRIGARWAGGPASAWWNDRALLGIALAAGVATDQIPVIVQLLAIALAVLLILRPGAERARADNA